MNRRARFKVNLMRRKILITGVSGCIGQAMAAHLSSCTKDRVLGADMKLPAASTCEFFAMDLLDQAAVTAFLRHQRPQWIFHLAGGRLADPQVMFRANVVTTQVLLGAILMIKGYRPRVVSVGTAAEYGECSGRGLITEKTSGDVKGFYGVCKSLQTRTALYFASLGVDVVVARLFNMLGPGVTPVTAGGKYAREIVRVERHISESEALVGHLRAVRDFLDIRDICAALCALAGRGAPGEVYNVCSQRGVTMRYVVAQMLRASVKGGITAREDLRQDPGVPFAVGSCAKLKKATGWRPRYSLRDSAADTLAWYRTNTPERQG